VAVVADRERVNREVATDLQYVVLSPASKQVLAAFVRLGDAQAFKAARDSETGCSYPIIGLMEEGY
jgi:hypothetical protein